MAETVEAEIENEEGAANYQSLASTISALSEQYNLTIIENQGDYKYIVRQHLSDLVVVHLLIPGLFFVFFI